MTDQHFGRLTEQPPKKTGRPSVYSQEIADRICQHIADGGYATDLQRFGLPSTTTVNKWLNENEAFAAAYARARLSRAETFAEQIVEIADTCEDPAKGRLQVEARKWVASKLFPRMYGENQRVEVQHTISDTAARVLAELSQRQRERKAIEAQVIDVTPVHSLDEGVPHQQDQQLTIDCTASAPRRRAGRGEPPAPATTDDPPLPETPPVSAKPRRKK